ncbi:PCI domain-containing protein 2 [Daktulosphaira vitifoliae]|uniref:PCI domain-containing protein 2 n=1 Tax=Daktulosphaira vitifoliae TaxID=58002 RepID=UPI0021AA7CF9|nr:PCI domain-containing protein 2 [Daktulosphaira vitifoliae]
MYTKDYVLSTNRFYNNENGFELANFFSLRNNSSKKWNEKNSIANLQRISEENELDFESEIVLHLNVLKAIEEQRYDDAFKGQLAILQNIVKYLQSSDNENWMIPLTNTICVDLRYLLNAYDKFDTTKKSVKAERYNDFQKKFIDVMMMYFRICSGDIRAPSHLSKRWAMMFIVNQMLQVYHKIKKFHLTTGLTKTIFMCPDKTIFPVAHAVTFYYFTGCKEIFEGKFNNARDYLTKSFQGCYKCSIKNKRLILKKLIPLNMLQGVIPSKSLLKKYDLEIFGELSDYLKMGNVKKFRECIDINEVYYMQCGVYLILQKLINLVYRNLLKKFFLIANNHIIPIETIAAVLKTYDDPETDFDQAQSLLVNLIYRGSLRGYLSHAHKKVVLSKKDPFPTGKQIFDKTTRSINEIGHN